jgi:hypothetical protein
VLWASSHELRPVSASGASCAVTHSGLRRRLCLFAYAAVVCMRRRLHRACAELRCRIELYLDQAAPPSGAGPGVSAGSVLEARRRTPGQHTQDTRIEPAHIGLSRRRRHCVCVTPRSTPPNLYRRPPRIRRPQESEGWSQLSRLNALTHSRSTGLL